MAATRHFQLGSPRGFSITSDGKYVTFLRSDHGRDAVNSLWVYDVNKNIEYKIVDPRALLADSEDIPAAEKARRERLRETTSGITSYSSDSTGYAIVFALAGQLFYFNLNTSETQQLEVNGPIIDPQVSPDGQLVAWSTGANVFICALDGTKERCLTPNESNNITWGLADFIAAEEFGRVRGFWWSPESTSLILERVDDADVNTWWISDPANPGQPPREQKYPQCGSANANVALHHVTLDGTLTEIVWDHDTYEYLINVSWHVEKQPLITISNRSQTEFVTCTLTEKVLTPVHTITDPQFVEVISGQPRWVNDELLTVIDNRVSDTRELHLGDTCLSPERLQVMSVIQATDEFVDVIGTTNATDRNVVRIGLDGSVRFITENGLASATPVTQSELGELRVVVHSKLDEQSRIYKLTRNSEVIHFFDSHAEQPNVNIKVTMMTTGPHAVNTAVLFPSDHVFGSKKLPILLRPYGGPHGAQVLNGATNYAEDQWFADQGFVVIVADGRGTPGRGPIWDHSIYQDFVTPVLDDQQTAIHDVAKQFPNDVDINRVGITGWSFGGYLSALAVLERPDVFHAAVAGAPVTDWILYDTAYTERYLGHPAQHPEVYAHNSLIERSQHLKRPLLLIHGLADDNVVAAHTLQLSSNLLAHKGEHSVLPLSGVTHMTPQEVVSENLALQSVAFFKKHLHEVSR